MEKTAIEKARTSIQWCEDALSDIRASRNYAAFSKAWAQFLLNANGIFFTLEKGASRCARSRQWYGGKKKQGKSDELIRYFVQARNAQHHGLEPVSEHFPGYKNQDLPSEAFRIKTDEGDGYADFAFHPVNGELPKNPFEVPHARLAPIFDDRSRKWFDPPYWHLGKEIERRTPLAVAELMMRYVTDLVDDAETFAG